MFICKSKNQGDFSPQKFLCPQQYLRTKNFLRTFAPILFPDLIRETPIAYFFVHSLYSPSVPIIIFISLKQKQKVGREGLITSSSSVVFFSFSQLQVQKYFVGQKMWWMNRRGGKAGSFYAFFLFSHFFNFFLPQNSFVPTIITMH